MTEVIRIIQGDLFPFSHILKYENGVAIDLSDATQVKLQMTPDTGGELLLDVVMDINTETAGKVTYVFRDNDTNTPGMYVVQFVIYYPDGSKRTVPSDNIQYVWIMKDLCIPS